MTATVGSSFVRPPVSTTMHGGQLQDIPVPELPTMAPPAPADPGPVDLATSSVTTGIPASAVAPDDAADSAADDAADEALFATLPSMREFFSLTRAEREPVDRGLLSIRECLASNDGIGICVAIEAMLAGLAFNRQMMLEHIKNIENDELMQLTAPLVRMLGEAKRRRRS